MKFTLSRLAAALGIAFFSHCATPEEPSPPTTTGTESNGDNLRTLAKTHDCGWSISQPSAKPFDRLEISGEWPAMQKPFLRILAAGATLPTYATIDTSEDGWSFSAPLGLDPWSDSTVELQVTDGTKSCEPQTLTIEALPRSERDGREILRSIRQRIAEAGVDSTAGVEAVSVREAEIAVYADDPEEVPLLLLGFLDSHPENPISFDSLESRLDDGDFELLAALTDLHGVDQVDPLATDPSALAAIHGCATSKAGIEDQERLSFMIRYCGRPSCNVVRAYDDKLLDSLNLASTAAGNVIVAGGIVSFTTISVASKIISAFYCATVPEAIEEVTAAPGYLSFEEDFEGPKRITEIKVKAVPGPAFNIPDRLVQGILQVLTVVSTYRSVSDALASSGDEFIWQEAFDKEGFYEELARVLMNQLAAYLGTEGDVTFGADPIFMELTTLDYVQLISENDRVLGVETDGKLGVEAIAIGEDRLTVYPVLEKFPGTEAFTYIDAEVLPISVSVEPVIKVTTPGALEVVNYLVDNAVDPSLEWGYQGEAPVVTTSTAGAIDVQMPLAEEQFPYQWGVRSISNTGLRRSDRDPPPRVASSLFILDDLHVSPRTACLTPGKTLELHASAAEGATIEWSGQGLSATTGPDVVFTAPTVPPDTTEVFAIDVTALSANEVFNDRVEFLVGDCNCRASFRSSAFNDDIEFDFTFTRAYDAENGVWGFVAFWGPYTVMWQSGLDRVATGRFPASLTSNLTEFSTDGPNGTLDIRVADDSETFEASFLGIVTDKRVPETRLLATAHFTGVSDFSDNGRSVTACRSKLLYDAWAEGRD